MLDRLQHLPVGALVPLILLAAAIGVAAGWLCLRIADRRGRRHLPAAPDNKQGHDIDLLIACRRINALPTTSRKERKP